MEEVPNSQYAIQIAVHTLRDRCKRLQQHVASLEEENVNLKIQCSRQETTKHSLNELDYLRAQVAELSEQKDQLQTKVKMITNENQELWSKLSKLTRVNQSLGSQLTKINDTLSQHVVTPNHPVIRSKTFTKSEIQTKVLQKNLEENNQISLELEDISLKLSDSFTKQKKELDLLCTEICEMTFTNDEIATDNCGFLLDDDLDNDMFVDIQMFGEEFNFLKEVVIHQQVMLELSVKNMDFIKDELQRKTCECSKPKLERSTSTMDLRTFEHKGTLTDTPNDKPLTRSKPDGEDKVQLNDRICPLCAKMFPKEVEFAIFQKHVEDHFVEAEDFEML